MTQIEELETLRTRVAVLEYELAEVTRTRGDDVEILCEHFGLTRSQAKILWCLRFGRVVSREYLVENCCLTSLSGIKTIDVQIYRMRRLLPFDIVATWGVGYSIDKDGVTDVKAVLSGEVAV